LESNLHIRSIGTKNKNFWKHNGQFEPIEEINPSQAFITRRKTKNSNIHDSYRCDVISAKPLSHLNLTTFS
jgi:hypothetical protein